ncbi:lymphocyte antigen 6H-like isoform X3 [Saccopteryx leptura]|uniref:lymphocyte antigen 6H-like isoform X3 n=1 Tax=Saccopteryx leptura TaxID=249018 RepID=UPI00339C9A6F
MRGLYLVLLTALLCYDHALSLRCYVCTGIQGMDQCHVLPCGGGSNVCYKGDLVTTLTNGQQTKVHHGSCAPSCEAASEAMQLVANSVQNPLISRTEVQGLSCCERDLCNGVTRAGRSLWALAGGLLLSLGPTLLWALL